MGSETSELTRQLIEIESNMIIDIGRALRSAARIGPAGDMTSIQEGMREKLPEADRKWQYALNELEMQILDAKAVLTRDLERIQPRGNTSITHKFLKGPIAPVFTMPPPPKEVTPPVNQMAPTPVPMSASQSHQSAPTASNTGTYKNTPVPPPVIPPGAIPMAPSNSTGSYSEPMTGSLSMTPIPVPPAGRNASPLTAKKDATGNRGVKASPAIGKAAPNKKGSPALTKAQVAKVSKSPNKKNSPAISKSTPSASKASPAVAKANLIKANMRKDSPAPATETGYTAGFGLPEQKQTPIPPPQIPVLATKPKAQKKKPALMQVYAGFGVMQGVK